MGVKTEKTAKRDSWARGRRQEYGKVPPHCKKVWETQDRYLWVRMESSMEHKLRSMSNIKCAAATRDS